MKTIMLIIVFVVLLIPVTKGMVILNLFHNYFMAGLAALFLQYLFFFALLILFGNRDILSKSILIRMLFGRMKKGKNYKIRILNHEISFEKYILSSVKGMCIALVGLFLVINISAVSMFIMPVILGDFQEEYENSCRKLIQSYEEAEREFLLSEIQKEFETEKKWDNLSLNEYLIKAFSSDLMEIYDYSALKRGRNNKTLNVYLEKQEKVTKLTSIDPFTYSIYSAKEFKDERKENLQILIDQIQLEQYDKYSGVYKSYSLIYDSYQRIMDELEGNEQASNKKYNAKNFINIEKRITNVQKRIITDDELDDLKKRNQSPKSRYWILTSDSGSCIADLEQYQKEKNRPEEGLDSGIFEIVFDCEKNYIKLYDSLETMKHTLDGVKEKGYKNKEIISSEQVIESITNYNQKSRNKKEEDNKVLEKTQKQLLDCINCSYSDQYNHLQNQLNALDYYLKLRKMQCEIDNPKGRINDSDDLILSLERMDDYYTRMKKLDYHSDIKILKDICKKRNVFDQVYALMTLSGQKWMVDLKIPKECRDLRDRIIVICIANGLFYILYVIVFINVVISKGRKRWKKKKVFRKK